MCLEKLSPFPRMLLGSLIGILLGIAIGLGAGLLIAFIAGKIDDNFPRDLYSLGSFLGMGFGAIVGSILGAVYVHKK